MTDSSRHASRQEKGISALNVVLDVAEQDPRVARLMIEAVCRFAREAGDDLYVREAKRLLRLPSPKRELRRSPARLERLLQRYEYLVGAGMERGAALDLLRRTSGPGWVNAERLDNLLTDARKLRHEAASLTQTVESDEKP